MLDKFKATQIHRVRSFNRPSKFKILDYLYGSGIIILERLVVVFIQHECARSSQ
jgi:hypothetical protein